MATERKQFGVITHAFDAASRDFMESDLAAVGLDEHDMFTTPLTIPPSNYGIPPGWALAAYAIPYFKPNGDILPGMVRYRVKYRDNITKPMLKEAEIGKYLGPSRQALIAHNLTTTEPYLYPWKGESRVVCITEGEKKAAKVSNDWNIRAIGIGGKDSWGERDGSRVVHSRILAAIVESQAEQVIIIADPDINEREDIRTAFSNFYFKLSAALPDVAVRLVVPPTEGSIKVDDWLASDDAGTIDDLVDVEGLELTRGIEVLETEFDLIRKRTARGLGGLEHNAYNAFQLISLHPLLKDTWRYNEDSNMIECDGKDHAKDDIGRVQGIMQRYLHLPNISRAIVEEAVRREALDHTYSPLYEDVMAADHWDGTDRLCEEYWGLDKAAMSVIRAMVTGFVKRVLFPGCHWRIMPILCGPNSVGKTGLSDWLVGPRGTVYELQKGQLARLDKDSTRQSMQPGILRIDDLDSFGGAEIGRLKAMVTARDSVLRVAYGKQDTKFKRRSIMVATTNHKYIIPDDPTGNTRFAACWIEKMLPFEKLTSDREQILAQAREMVDIDFMPTDIDFDAMREYRESSPMRQKLDDFLDDLISGDIHADNSTIWRVLPSKGGVTPGVYFKADRFWLFFGKEPTMYDYKNFKPLANEYHLKYFGKDDRVRLNGKQVKNVYLLPSSPL